MAQALLFEGAAIASSPVRDMTHVVGVSTRQAIPSTVPGNFSVPSSVELVLSTWSTPRGKSCLSNRGDRMLFCIGATFKGLHKRPLRNTSHWTWYKQITAYRDQARQQQEPLIDDGGVLFEDCPENFPTDNDSWEADVGMLGSGNSKGDGVKPVKNINDMSDPTGVKAGGQQHNHWSSKKEQSRQARSEDAIQHGLLDDLAKAKAESDALREKLIEKQEEVEAFFDEVEREEAVDLEGKEAAVKEAQLKEEGEAKALKEAEAKKLALQNEAYLAHVKSNVESLNVDFEEYEEPMPTGFLVIISILLGLLSESYMLTAGFFVSERKCLNNYKNTWDFGSWIFGDFGISYRKHQDFCYWQELIGWTYITLVSLAVVLVSLFALAFVYRLIALCRNRYRFNYKFKRFLNFAAIDDSRPDFLRTGKLNHTNPLYAEISFVDRGKKFSIFRGFYTHSRNMFVSMEVLMQISISSNFSFTASDSVVFEKIQFAASKLDSVNLDRSLVLNRKHPVQDSILVSYALYKQYRLSRDVCPFPRTPAV